MCLFLSPYFGRAAAFRSCFPEAKVIEEHLASRFVRKTSAAQEAGIN